MADVTEVSLREDPAGWAERGGGSRTAIDLFAACEVIDLHVESFVWSRVFGYDLAARHRRALPQHRWWGQVDLPRARAGGGGGRPPAGGGGRAPPPGPPVGAGWLGRFPPPPCSPLHRATAAPAT